MRCDTQRPKNVNARMGTFSQRQSSFSTVLLISQRHVLMECYILKIKHQKTQNKWSAGGSTSVALRGPERVDMLHCTEEGFLSSNYFCDTLPPIAIFPMQESLPQLLPFIFSLTPFPSHPLNTVNRYVDLSLYVFFSHFFSSVYCFLAI